MVGVCVMHDCMASLVIIGYLGILDHSAVTLDIVTTGYYTPGATLPLYLFAVCFLHI